ncbi:Ryanodine receptor 2, partial [Buceros rhinoceros silvestris]
TLQQLISDTMVRWAQESVIEDPELVRAMFVLLHRQYDGIGGLVRALPKTYTINSVSVEDTINLLASLGQIRSLLSVRMGKEEEKLMIRGLGPQGNFSLQVVNNCAVNQLCSNLFFVCSQTLRESLCLVVCFEEQNKILILMKRVISKCWQLFIRKCLLLNAQVCSPVLSSMALGEIQSTFTWVVRYLAGCGLQSCPLLIFKGYPDIGWNPVEGERYLDFLRFAVFCNGESVEENANVVVRLLIR